MCLGRIGEFEIELSDTGINQWPIYRYTYKEGYQWVFKEDVNEQIAEFMEELDFTNMKDLYKELVWATTKGDLKDCYDRAVKNQALLEQLEADIEAFKNGAKKMLTDAIEYEVRQFIDEEYGIDLAIEKAEAGDRACLDTILMVSTNYLRTSRNAVVPKVEALHMLEEIDKGTNIEGQHIGPYTVNRLVRKPDDIYVKIGCHLFSVAQTKEALKL